MFCQRCGNKNPDSARICSSCNTILIPAPPVPEKPIVKTSRLAVVSLILAITGLFAFPVTLVTKSLVILFVVLISVISAVIFGIVGLVQIGISAGRLAGRGFAVIGLVTPVILFFLVFSRATLLARKHMSLSSRMHCAGNLSGIGKAMFTYANDYDGQFPRAAGPNSVWGQTANWKADSISDAFGLKDGVGRANISASLYLLVKYFDVHPRSFICKSDAGVTEFKYYEYRLPRPDFDIIDAWDFGPNPAKHCSYSYHIPYGKYALTTSDEHSLAVAADRNPWIQSPFSRDKDFSRFYPYGTEEQQIYGNALAHQEEGQNVLFLDGHVSFEQFSFCGFGYDNIYTYWSGPDIRRGVPPALTSQPADRLDSLLVNDPLATNRK